MGVLLRTSRARKSVWVSSVLGGPRSWDLGAARRLREERVNARVGGGNRRHVRIGDGAKRKVLRSRIVGRGNVEGCIGGIVN